jgi:hypothetical protein
LAFSIVLEMLERRSKEPAAENSRIIPRLKISWGFSSRARELRFCRFP